MLSAYILHIINYFEAMLKRVFLGAAIVLIFSSHSLSGQVEQDKALHFAAGVVSGALGGFIASEISDKNRFWIMTGSIGTSLLAGLAKEAIDQNRNDGAWDNADLGFTVLGGVTAGVTLSLFTGKKKRKRQQEVFRSHYEFQEFSALTLQPE